MPTYYSTAFAHLVSAGASIWAIKVVRSSLISYDLPLYSFGSFLVNSAIGVLTFGSPEHGDKLKGMYGRTLLLSQCLGLPCIATQLSLNYGLQRDLAYLHIGFAIVPIVAYFLEDKSQKVLLNMVTIGNLISVSYFSFVHKNHYGLAMAASYAINHFVIGTEGTCFDTSIPALDLFMYGLCFFNFFAIKALFD